MTRRFVLLCAAALIGGACTTTLVLDDAKDGGTNTADGGLDGLSETGVLDAGPDAPNVPQIVVTGLTGPRSIGIDSTDVYWITLDPDAGSQGSLGRAPKGGGGPATTIASGITQITSFRLRPEAIYLTAYYGDVRRYPRDAGASAPYEVIDDTVNTNLEVTSDDAYIYWLTLAGGGTGRLRVRALDGGAFTQHIVPDAGTLQGNLLAAGNATYFGANRQLFVYDKGNPDAGIGPRGGAVDVRPLVLDDGVLYVARGTPNTVTIARWTPAGVELSEVVTVSKLDAFAMDASFIYYVTLETMYRIPKTGGAPTKLFQATGLQTFAMDESYFYWPNSTEGTIYRMRR